MIQNKTYGGTTTTISPLIFLTDATKDEVLIEENNEHDDNWFDSISVSSSKEEDEEDIDKIKTTSHLKDGHSDTSRVKSSVKGYSKPKENQLSPQKEEKTKTIPKLSIKTIIKRYILQNKFNSDFV